MIEKIGMRAAEFVGSMARRVAGAAEDVVNDHRKPKHRFVKVALPAVAAGAAAVAAAASGVANKNGSTSNTGSSNNARSNGSGPSRASSTAKSAAKDVKDKASDTAEKTREELYELAKKADIPGRSSMSKQELEKALKK